MPDEPTDRDLVARSVAGDRVAFALLVKRHERRVYNLAYRVLGREEDARDATQDTLMTALRRLSSYRGEAAFTTWLHRVTVNACYDILRKRKREPSLELVDAVETNISPHDHAESTATAVDVQRALLEVPLDFRAPLVMHDVQDMAYEDIAETLGVPVGTVKSRIHRGRVALARALGVTPGERSGSGRPSEERNVQ
ncbi:MAG: sigma-70 family RNA polymerase sigma factor [Actinomycetota bacterium]